MEFWCPLLADLFFRKRQICPLLAPGGVEEKIGTGSKYSDQFSFISEFSDKSLAEIIILFYPSQFMFQRTLSRTVVPAKHF